MREGLNAHLPNTPPDAALEAALEAIAQVAGRSAGAEVLAAQAWGLMIGYHAR